MKLGLNFFIMLSAITFICGGLYLYSPEKSKTQARLSVPTSVSATLPILAKELGFFDDQDLHVELLFAGSTAGAIAELEKQNADLAISDVSSVVTAITRGMNIQILGQIDRLQDHTVVVYRKDRLQSPQDLKGKRIALVPNTNADFFLNMFLNLNSVTSSDVTFVAVTKKELVAQLEKGKVDAAVLWQPDADDLIRRRPSFGVMHSTLYSEFSGLVAKADLASSNPEIVERMWQALIRAQTYYEIHRSSAREIVEATLAKESSKQLRPGWKRLSIQVGATNIFKTMIQEELLWRQTGEGIIPSGEASYIQASILKAIAPESVVIQ